VGRYLLRRILVSLFLVWVVLTATFVVLHAAPGDPTERFADPRVPRAQLAELRALYGLDRPLPVQYAAWLAATARFDWGLSFQHQRPVRTVVAERLPATLLLGAAAFSVQVVVGLALGIFAARRPNSLGDHATRVVSLALYSLPGFWLALMLSLLLAGILPVFPSGGMTSTFARDWSMVHRLLDLLAHLALPALALGLPLAAPVARLLRTGLLEELGKDYILAARARGLSERAVFLRALRGAAAPLVQVAGLTLPALLGGSVVIEFVFSWPGLGATAYDGILARDYPLVLAATAFTAGLVVAGNLVADVALAALDPRVIERA
jgi:peptide/nickel transport system permease protein